jgi:predicted dehydrogenase
MNDLKFVLVGYGNIAKKHLEVFKALNVYFSASCNRSKEKREEAKNLCGIPRTYENPEEMVEKEEPDGILITTSFTENFKVAKKLIKYKIPILLEKPPATSYKDAKELEILSKKYKTPVMIGLNRRFYSIYLKALEKFGGMDNINYIYVEWSENPQYLRSIGYKEEEIKIFNYANSLHGIDLVLFFAGNIKKYKSWGRNLGRDEEFRWQMGFEGENKKGAKINFYSNWDVPGRWRCLVDFNSTRAVFAPLETIQILSNNGKEIKPDEEDNVYKPGFFGQAKYFIDVVKNNKKIEFPACSLKESLKAIKIAEDLTNKCLGKI